MRSISAGVAALAIGLALKSGIHGVGVAYARLQVEPEGISVVEKTNGFDLHASLGSKTPNDSAVRVASLEPEVSSEPAVEGQPEFSASATPGADFDERFFFDRGLSFDERFAGVVGSTDSAMASAAETEPPANDLLLMLPSLGEHLTATPPVAPAAPPPAGRPAPKLAAVTSSTPANISKKRLAMAELPSESSSPHDDSRTAIYDIAAHTVYLPNGHRLEAHSGLGGQLDDPRYINAKNRGPTPPNVYGLVLREQLFHGVRAIRLIPADGGKMYGRDGILAHPYMLGPNGQSNGCVSFSDYPAFLNAFLKGDVDHLVVVEHLATAPSPKTASGWLPDTIKNIFRRS